MFGVKLFVVMLPLYIPDLNPPSYPALAVLYIEKAVVAVMAFFEFENWEFRAP